MREDAPGPKKGGVKMTSHPLDGLISVLGAINEGVGRTGRLIAGLFLLLMTIVVGVQVVSRYALGSPASWTEEVSRTLMVWIGFLVAPWAYRHGAHVAITMFQDALPARLRALLEIVLTALIIWIAAVFLGESVGFVLRGLKSQALSLPVPTGVLYTVIPVSLGAIILVAIEMIARGIRECLTGRPSGEGLGDFLRPEM